MSSHLRARKGKASVYLQRGMSDEISYEDVLLAQYMDEIQKSPPVRKEREAKLSPYAVSAHSHSSTQLKRPKSAILSGKGKSRGSADPITFQSTPQTVIGWADKADWTMTERRPKQRTRPVSAPATRTRSSSVSSGTSSFSRRSSVSSSASGKKTKPLYKKKPPLICIRAFQNGNRDNYARIAVPDLAQLLDACTDKLGLVSAARKLFLSDGTPVTHPRQLSRDVDVYVSCGEAFRDPYASILDREELRRSASWTLSGIVLPEDRSRGRTKPSLSKRMQSLVESQKRRILVFRNGESSEGVEIIAGRFDEFLDDCTKKLNLESGARLLFDWQGKEIKSFSEVPVLDRVLQPSVSVILGPVWVTRGGERFSPKGAYHFITTLLLSTKDRLKQSKAYKLELEKSLKDEEVVSKEIMAMSEAEIENEIKEVDQHITDLSSVIPTLQSHLGLVEAASREEVSAGLENYRYQHLSQIAPESRLLGKQGLKLKVYENGSADGGVIVYFNLHEAEKGIQGDKAQLMHRFLDTCTSSQKVSDSSGGPAGRRIAKRVYTREGEEITDVYDLVYDQQIWLSYGEDFKPPHVVVLQLCLDKATCLSLWGEKEMVQRESFDDEGKGKEKASLWKAVNGFPSGSKRHLVNLLNPGSELSQAQNLQMMRVDENGCFLQYKENKNLVLYPELSVTEKKKKGDRGSWLPDPQGWVVTQSGLIHSKAMPQLVLSRSEHAITVTYGDKVVEGCPVVVSKRNPSDVSQQWGFSPSGQIYSLSKPSLVLTYIGDHEVKEISSDERPSNTSLIEQESSSGLRNLNFMDEARFGEQISITEGANMELSPSPSDGTEERTEAGLEQLKDEFLGQKYSVVLLPKKHGDGTQRWAIKQEDLSNIGQWKYSTVSNPEWNKRALSWPVNEDGTWNTDFTWPMEGFLLPFAPPVKKASQKTVITAGTPARLRVLKNGESDHSRAVTVVGPDLTNMLHDVNGTSPKSPLKKHKRRATLSKHEHAGEDSAGSCHPRDHKQLELDLFLDRCTEAVGLPFAARRLYTEDGKEVARLSELERNQLVYVTCGEPWSDPQLSYSEQQRRAVLANLAADISHIRQYCALREPSDLVLQVDGAVTTGSRVCVVKCALSSDEREKLASGKNDEELPMEEESREDIYSHALNAHERSHIRAEQRLNSLRWSWENEKTLKDDPSVDDKDDDDFVDEVMFSDRQLQRKFRRQVLKTLDSKPADPCQRQRWSLNNDGFISLKGTSLVLGLTDSSNEGKSEVVLCKKKLEDFTQRWVVAEDGSIYQRSNQQLVLTVTTPPLANDPFTLDYSPEQGFEGAAVIVAHRKGCANGNASQLWRYDPITGFIEAFSADTTNREISAANKANVCTFAVLGPQQVPQPGYVYMFGTSKETYLCEACGKVSRGRHKLQRLHQYHTGFACALGTAQEKGLRLSSSFKCLNSKVDLSTLEAEATLDLWEHQLGRLRNEGSVRTITRELHMAQSVPAVRIRAFKNGEGSRGHGEIIIGSSIHALLDQCTVRLGLASAARRLYTCCGELITDVQQLIRPYAMRNEQDNETETQQQIASFDSKANKIPEERLLHNGHAVDVVEAENRPFSKTKGSRLTAAEEREKELLETEAFDKLNISDDEHEDDQSSGNVTFRVSEGRTGPVPIINGKDQQDFPRWDARWPIDVWVSCGEPFMPLEEADKQYLLSMKHREERTWVQAYLDQEKHVLRHMQGRRINGMSPPSSPRGNGLTVAWHEPTRAEEKKEEAINELKNHLHGVKSRQSQSEVVLSKSAKESTRRLYSKPKTVRVNVFPNGEGKQRSVVAFGATMQELLDASTARLNLSSAARRLFTQDGDEITNFDEIERDQYVCVSCGEGFLRARDRQHRQELKATWSRLNRQSGGTVIPGEGPVTRNSVTFDNTILALPAPVSPPPPSRVPPSPTRQMSVHRMSSRH
nr:doublecortin domain-containing protein 1-like [Pocillopora verrucosa]